MCCANEHCGYDVNCKIHEDPVVNGVTCKCETIKLILASPAVYFVFLIGREASIASSKYSRPL